MGAVEVGVALPVFDSLGQSLPAVAESATAAELAGLDFAWAGDHLFFNPPNHESLISLAFAAAATKRIRVGTGVLLVALREPVALAKQLSTLSNLSGNRLFLGVGVGGEYPAEWAAVGADLRNRGDRTDDILDFIRLAFSGEAIEFEGKTFRVVAPPMLPRPATQPFTWVGGRSRAALARAVRVGDGWLGVWMSPSAVSQVRAELERRSDLASKPPPRLGMVVFVNVGLERKAHAESADYVRRHYALDYEAMSKWFLCGSVESITEQLSELVSVGVSSFFIYPTSPDYFGHVEQIGKVSDLLNEV